MLLAVPSGLALGTLAAVNRGRLADRVIMACSVAGVSMPVFFIGLILIHMSDLSGRCCRLPAVPGRYGTADCRA